MVRSRVPAPSRHRPREHRVDARLPARPARSLPRAPARDEKTGRMLQGPAFAYDRWAFSESWRPSSRRGSRWSTSAERDDHGTASTQAFELITTGRLAHDGDPVRKHVANTTAILTERGMKVTKPEEGHAPQERRLRRPRHGGRHGDAGGSEALRPDAACPGGLLMPERRGPPHRAGRQPRVVARPPARLEARRLDLETYEAYYDGHQPLAFASQKFRDAFGLPLPGVQLQLHEPRRGRSR